MKSVGLVGGVVVVMVLVCGAGLQAQSTKVELAGAVRDPAGLPIQGAGISLVNSNTQGEQAYVTGPDGEYHFFALQPGIYTMTITKNGFTTLSREGVALRVGDH